MADRGWPPVLTRTCSLGQASGMNSHVAHVLRFLETNSEIQQMFTPENRNRPRPKRKGSFPNSQPFLKGKPLVLGSVLFFYLRKVSLRNVARQWHWTTSNLSSFNGCSSCLGSGERTGVLCSQRAGLTTIEAGNGTRTTSWDQMVEHMK